MNTVEYKVKIEYHNNGQKKSEHWYLNGLYHREDGPAYQSWYSNGQKCSENWYLNKQLHREDGPAFQSWYENGQKCYERWYLTNINVTEQEFKLKTDPEYKKYLELKSKFENK